MGVQEARANRQALQQEPHQMTDRFRRAGTRYQVPFFVLLTMGMSWLFIPVSDGGLLSQGPMFAALVVLGIVCGRRGVADL